MYCSHCGTENENTAKFCRQCGNALQANAQSNSAPSAFEQEISASKGRQSVANFLRAFQAHVAPQAKNYSVLNAQCSQMEMLERQRADFEKRVKSPVLLILGIVLIALGIGLIVSFVSYMQAHIDEAVIIENPTLADYLDTFVALLFLAGPLIIGGIIIAILLAILVYIVITKTTFGYELRACGANRHAARYAGIHDKRNIILSMAIAGALAGAAGSLYYLSGNTEFFWTTYQSLPAAGFNGIAVALLAVNNPIAVIFTGCFMSILDIAGLQITNLTVYNEYITDVIIAVIVYMAAFSLIIKMWIAERQKKRAKKAEQAAPAAPAAETPAEKREEVQK